MNGTHTLPHPIPYQGSKRQIAPIILEHLPGKIRRLVEPFCGSAAVSLAVANRKLAQAFWINDAHQPLIAVWREMIERPGALADAYAELWNQQIGRERAAYDVVRANFNRHHKPADFLYLLARSVKSVVRYNASGEFNNTPDNRRLGTRPAAMRRRLLGAAQLLQKCQATSWDYQEVLAKCRQTDVIYMDPPYQGVSGQRDPRYAPKITHEAFCGELASLNQRGLMFAVSYDGRTGNKHYGKPLPNELNLTRIEVCAGRSSQATLLGRTDVTYESLYLSPALVKAVEHSRPAMSERLAL
jgi:DNA adenine methylase